jgi:hypothetical protein
VAAGEGGEMVGGFMTKKFLSRRSYKLPEHYSHPENGGSDDKTNNGRPMAATAAGVTQEDPREAVQSIRAELLQRQLFVLHEDVLE